MIYRSLFQRTNIDFRFLPIHSLKLVYHLELLIQNSNIFAPALEVWGRVQKSEYFLSFPECGFPTPHCEKLSVACYIHLIKFTL